MSAWRDVLASFRAPDNVPPFPPNPPQRISDASSGGNGGIGGGKSRPLTVVSMKDSSPRDQSGTEPSEPSLADDAEAFLDHLRREGPQTYGAVAHALAWGATRAWQAEARLRAEGKIKLGADGRAFLRSGI